MTMYLPFVCRGTTVRVWSHDRPWPCRSTFLGIPCDRAPSFSGFQSCWPNTGIAFLWPWFLGALCMFSVHLFAFMVLCLKCTHQSPLLEVKTAVVLPLEAYLSAVEPIWVQCMHRHAWYTCGQLPQFSPQPPLISIKVCWLPTSHSCRKCFSTIPSLWFMIESIFLNLIGGHYLQRQGILLRSPKRPPNLNSHPSTRGLDGRG